MFSEPNPPFYTVFKTSSNKLREHKEQVLRARVCVCVCVYVGECVCV